MTQKWKTVRIFISSTFRDMQAERDQLVRFVFPRLREQLIQYHIHLVEVDLRWGVTSDQDASEVCREIINECQPRFLCMLGGRYGWVPPGKSYSITDDEVHFGVLKRSFGERNYSFFYFREDAVTDSIVEITPGEFRESPDSDNQKKLVALKQKIIDAGLNPFYYQADWDNDSKRLINLKSFGERVYDDLLNNIQTDLELREHFITRGEAAIDEFTGETASMEAFIEEHCERFVIGSRKPLIDDLLTIANGEGGSYVCLVGLPGCGKSALLSYLSRDDSLNVNAETLLIKHFVGASPASNDIRLTLRRFCHEIQAGCPDITGEIPDDPEELKSVFVSFLDQASTHKRIVILLDAVNQFNRNYQFSGFQWLPQKLPSNVCIILSTIAGATVTELQSHIPTLCEKEVRPLTASDGEEIIDHFSKRYHKVINPEQRAALLSKSDAGMPIYLLIALEELRTLSVSRDVVDSQDQDQAVLGLIAQLPPTTHELFKWILERLQNDDGFRDEVGQKVGKELVSRFATLLGASRHGLSQQELSILLSPNSSHGNLSALIYLLRPYLMQRGELLDFYHSQLRQAASDLWLNTVAQQRNAHLQLARYFRDVADPSKQNEWKQDARALSELPYHLAKAEQKEELQNLFNQLAFLAARVATGQVYEQIMDFSLLEHPLHPALIAWHDFLQKHAQRLIEHPEMLVALVNHEGSAEARNQVEDTAWDHPWIRTSPEELPPSEIKENERLHVQVNKKLEFPWGRVSAIAPWRDVAFVFEKLGLVRIFDLKAMRQTDITFPIRHDRPLVIVCAPDASSVTVFFESSKAELYQCTLSADGFPRDMKLVAEFNFCLPESEDPVVVWNKNAYWFQKTATCLASISDENPPSGEQEINLEQQGELAGLYFNDDSALIALRQGADALLIFSNGQSQRISAAQLLTISPCGDNTVAAAFTDGKLIIFKLGDTLTRNNTINVGLICGVLGWDGSFLLWRGDRDGFSAWDLKSSSIFPVQDNEEVFHSNLHVVPHQWISQPDGSMLLGTTHGFVSFQISFGNATTNGRLEEIFGGPTWQARIKDNRDHWLMAKQPFHQILLKQEVMGRLYCAKDGKGNFFAVDSFGVGFILDLKTLQSTPLNGHLSGLNIAEGDENGGCWFSDRSGEIYFADPEGKINYITKVELDDIHGSYLKSCGDHLVWVGYSSKFFPETGLEPSRTFVVFNKTPGNPPTLEKAGEQFRHPREGQCPSFCYDRAHDAIVSLWAKSMEGTDTYYLKVGSIDDLVEWKLQEINVNGFGLYRHVQSTLSIDGKFLGIVNSGGEIKYISVENGDVKATLAVSSPFTAIAVGEKDAEFWVVEAYSRIFKCKLGGGKL